MCTKGAHSRFPYPRTFSLYQIIAVDLFHLHKYLEISQLLAFDSLCMLLWP